MLNGIPVRNLVVSNCQVPAGTYPTTTPTMSLAKATKIQAFTTISGTSGLANALASLQTSTDQGATWQTQQALAVTADGNLNFTDITSPDPTWNLLRVAYSASAGTLAAFTTTIVFAVV